MRWHRESCLRHLRSTCSPQQPALPPASAACCPPASTFSQVPSYPSPQALSAVECSGVEVDRRMNSVQVPKFMPHAQKLAPKPRRYKHCICNAPTSMPASALPLVAVAPRPPSSLPPPLLLTLCSSPFLPPCPAGWSPGHSAMQWLTTAMVHSMQVTRYTRPYRFIPSFHAGHDFATPQHVEHRDTDAGSIARAHRALFYTRSTHADWGLHRL